MRLMAKMVVASLCAVCASGVVMGQIDDLAGPDVRTLGPRSTVRYDNHRLVRAHLKTAQDLLAITQISDDHWGERLGIGSKLFRIAPDRMAQLDASGIEYDVVQENIQALIDAEAQRIAARAVQRGAGFDFLDYHPYATVNTYLTTLDDLELQAGFTAKTEVFNVGQTLEGRDVFGIRITGAGNAFQTKPALLLNSAQHAREWVSVSTTMYIADQLIRTYDTDPMIQELLDATEVIIVPMVNADGYSYSWTDVRLWRKNRRNNAVGGIGVDPNRNWSFQWGGPFSSGSGGAETYRGPAPFSEPCTANMRDFFLANTHIVSHVDLHSFSQVVLGAWGYTNDPAPMGSILLPLGQGFNDAVQAVNGAVYQFGTGGFLLGNADGIMPDWTFGDQGIFSWTLELRDTGANGFILPPSEIIPTGTEALGGAVFLLDAIAHPLDITHPSGLPVAAEPGAAVTALADIKGVFGALDPATAKLFARIGGAGVFAESALAPVGGDLYEGTLPVGVCGDTIEYYFEAQTTEGVVARSPIDAPTSVFTVDVRESTVAFAENFEVGAGWTGGVPGDTAGTGVWELVDPNGTGAQPEDDNPAGTGTMCFITGQGAVGGGLGDNDVDGGFTTLLSPALDATAETGDAVVSYYRWYSNNGGGNPNTETMRIEISDDDGGSWTALETVSENANAWVFRSFRVADFVTQTSQMRVRFIAEDDPGNGGAIVEAGVDDVSLTFLDCPGVFADLNGDGVVGSADFALLLGSWGPCPTPPALCIADLDGDGSVGSSDLALMLGAWG